MESRPTVELDPSTGVVRVHRNGAAAGTPADETYATLADFVERKLPAVVPILSPLAADGRPLFECRALAGEPRGSRGLFAAAHVPAWTVVGEHAGVSTDARKRRALLASLGRDDERAWHARLDQPDPADPEGRTLVATDPLTGELFDELALEPALAAGALPLPTTRGEPLTRSALTAVLVTAVRLDERGDDLEPPRLVLLTCVPLRPGQQVLAYRPPTTDEDRDDDDLLSDEDLAWLEAQTQTVRIVNGTVVRVQQSREDDDNEHDSEYEEEDDDEHGNEYDDDDESEEEEEEAEERKEAESKATAAEAPDVMDQLSLAMDKVDVAAAQRTSSEFMATSPLIDALMPSTFVPSSAADTLLLPPTVQAELDRQAALDDQLEREQLEHEFEQLAATMLVTKLGTVDLDAARRERAVVDNSATGDARRVWLNSELMRYALRTITTTTTESGAEMRRQTVLHELADRVDARVLQQWADAYRPRSAHERALVQAELRAACVLVG